MNPGKVLVFLLGCYLTVAVFSVVAEKIGSESGELCIQLGSSSHCLKYFTISEIIGLNEFEQEQERLLEKKQTITAVAVKEEELKEAMISPLDSLVVLETLADSDSARFWLPAGDRSFWGDIFSHWENLEERGELYRILHHGDSQI